MSNLRELHHCLDVEFERNKEARTITMNQMSYIKEILKRFNMEECKPVGTPFDGDSKLLKLPDEEFRNVHMEMKGVPFKASVGSLIYAMVAMRTDIAIAVSKSIYFEGRFTVLDGRETHHEVFEVHFGLHVMPQMQGYCLEGILQCRLGGRCKQLTIHHEGHVFLLTL